MITTRHATPPSSHAPPPPRAAPSPPEDEADDALDSTFPTPAFPFDGVRFPPPLGGRAEGRTVLFRALGAILIAWVPLAVLSAVEGLALGPTRRESFLFDVAAYSRFLIALPLLILAEAVALPLLGHIVRHLARPELLPETERPRYDALVALASRLVRSPLAAMIIVAIAFAATLTAGQADNPANVGTWVAPSGDGDRALSLAGMWRTFVSQPLYVALVLTWIWRAMVWAIFLRKVSRLELRLVASHPDHMGGLRFVMASLRAFSPVGFALAVGISGGIADRVLFGGTRVTEFAPVIGVVVVLLIVLFVGPLFVLRKPLKKIRTRAIFSYGRLASGVGYHFEREWLRPADDVPASALQAPEFSATTDLYSIVVNANTVKGIPLDLQGVVPLILATLLPFVPLALFEMPLVELLKLAVGLVV
jgi:hypothetical protein